MEGFHFSNVFSVAFLPSVLTALNIAAVSYSILRFLSHADECCKFFGRWTVFYNFVALKKSSCAFVFHHILSEKTNEGVIKKECAELLLVQSAGS